MELATLEHDDCVNCAAFSPTDQETDIVDPEHQSSIFRSVIQPCMWFSMMEQVRLCTVCPVENWLGTSKTTYRAGLVE